jgi:hypothetical protein
MLATVLFASGASAAQIGLAFTESNHGGVESATAVFGNDPSNVFTGASVTPSSGTGEAWSFNFSGSGHSTDGGDFLFNPGAVMTWYEPNGTTYNNLYFVSSTSWLLESEQPVPANTNNDGIYGIFNLGTSIYAGIDSYNGDQVFASVNESVAAVPEPETYAMLLAGLGLLGFMARRRKQKYAA